MKKLFVHPTIIARLRFDQIDIPGESEKLVTRPYQILAHAEDRIERSSSDFDLIDGVCTLKRAVMYRLKCLRLIYRLKQMKLKDLPKDQFDQLFALGLIRKGMLGSLLEVRRIVEHHDGAPPSKERCQELSEFVWYFLKATDYLLSKVTEGMQAYIRLKGREPEYHVQVDVTPKNDWKIKIYGSLPPFALSTDFQAGWYEFILKKLDRHSDAPIDKSLGLLGLEPEIFFPEDLHFEAELDPNSSTSLVLIKRYFSSVV